MNDLDQIEEAADEGNEPAILQRQFIKVMIAICRRLDYIIAVDYPPNRYLSDLQQIEQAANEGNEPAVLQRQLVKAMIAICRRLDHVIDVDYVPKVRQRQAEASKPAPPETPDFTRVEAAEPVAEGEVVEHTPFTES